MLQEQADWYQGKTDPYETTISFCIVNSEHWQTSEMEIFPEINSGYFYKRLRLRFARVPRSVSAELRSHNVALAFTTNRPARKTRHCGRSKRFSERCSVYKSNLTDTRYGELKEILNVILNIVHKTHCPFVSYEYVLKKYCNEKIRTRTRFRIWFEGSWGSSFYNNFEKYSLARIFFFRFSSKPLWWSTCLLKFASYSLWHCKKYWHLLGYSTKKDSIINLFKVANKQNRVLRS